MLQFYFQPLLPSFNIMFPSRSFHPPKKCLLIPVIRQQPCFSPFHLPHKSNETPRHKIENSFSDGTLSSTLFHIAPTLCRSYMGSHSPAKMKLFAHSYLEIGNTRL